MKRNDPDLWISIAAGYQVSRWPYANIAEALDTNLDTVKRNINIVAEHIELTLRTKDDDPAWTPDRIRKAIEKFNL